MRGSIPRIEPTYVGPIVEAKKKGTRTGRVERTIEALTERAAI
jgi:uncharacterized protein YdeI (YjbR/CyaY-like superfamily)